MISPPVHFLTFGGGSSNLRRSAKRLANEAEKFGVFTSIHCLTNFDLQKKHFDFYNQLELFRDSLNDKGVKGYGRWAWKPYLILQYLKLIPEDDILLYLDAGCHFNINKVSKERFLMYCKSANTYESLAMQLYSSEFSQMDALEYEYNSYDNKNELSISETDWNSHQIQAGILFLKNNTKVRNFVQVWLDLCFSNNFKNLNENLIVQTDKHFKEYRWDQSIFSLLYKKYKMNVIFDETWWGDSFQSNGVNYPIWALRHKSGVTPFKKGLPQVFNRIVSRLSV
jgi:hypothetical protein